MKTYDGGLERRVRLAKVAYDKTHGLSFETIHNCFIGAMSVLVDNDAWDQALDTVKRMIKEMEKKEMEDSTR